MWTTWATQLDPLIKNPLTQGRLVSNISIKPGVNVINTLLSRKQQGYIITDQDSAAKIYRSAALNDKTLTLTSDISSTISLWVF